jgi:hypothetical protein
MPQAIGGSSGPGEDGAFLKGMVDYVAQGPKSLNAILAQIDRAWPP